MRSFTALVCITLQTLQDQSDCESTDLARERRWTRGRHTAGQGLQYIAPVVDYGAEYLMGRWYSRGQAHEVFLHPGAATTVTPAWIVPLGAVMTLTPAKIGRLRVSAAPLGAAMTVTPAWSESVLSIAWWKQMSSFWTFFLSSLQVVRVPNQVKKRASFRTRPSLCIHIFS